MIASTFAELLEEYAHTQAEDKHRNSWSWFLNEAKKIRTITSQIKTNEISPTQAVVDKDVEKYPYKIFPKTVAGVDSIIGKMILFQYDAKHKATLPFWDQFPIGFPIKVYNNGYLMLNLHYLPEQYRANLMDSLYSLLINKEKLDDKSRLKISYEVLTNNARFRYYQPTIKRYLYNHVKSKWSVIPGDQWDVAMMLPLQRWQKASQATVWRDSMRKINKS